MKTYSGKVNFIGAGTWQASSGGAGKTQLTVLEIGNHHFRNITVADYLSNYMKVGEEVEILVYKSFLLHSVLGVKVNGRVFKPSTVSIALIFHLQMIMFCMVVGGGGIAVATINESFLIGLIAIGLCIAYIWSKIKAIARMSRFA